MTTPATSNDARDWWIRTQAQLRAMASQVDRFRSAGGGPEDGKPFTASQLRMMEYGIGRALDSVSENAPAV